MLLEFRLRNFRSFRQEATLSLVASTDKELEDTNTIPTALKAIPRAVRSAVIYGPNASGKTNVLTGLGFMQSLIAGSASLQPGQTLNFQPFRLDADAVTEPTLFEITLLLDGARYQYGFEFNATRVVAEWLLVYTKQKPQRWIDRKSWKTAMNMDRRLFWPARSASGRRPRGQTRYFSPPPCSSTATSCDPSMIG